MHKHAYITKYYTRNQRLRQTLSGRFSDLCVALQHTADCEHGFRCQFQSPRSLSTSSCVSKAARVYLTGYVPRTHAYQQHRLNDDSSGMVYQRSSTSSTTANGFRWRLGSRFATSRARYAITFFTLSLLKLLTPNSKHDKLLEMPAVEREKTRLLMLPKPNLNLKTYLNWLGYFRLKR